MPDVSTLSPQYRPNIAHLVTIFVSLSDSSETHLSTGRVRQTFASKGKRRAIRDDLGEVKGPRDTSSYNPPAAAAFPRVGRTNGTVGAEQKGRHIPHRRSQLEWPKSTALDCALYVRNIGRWRPATSSWDCLRGRPQPVPRQAGPETKCPKGSGGRDSTLVDQFPMLPPVHWGIVEPCRTFTTSEWSSPPCSAEHTRSVGHQVCCIPGDLPQLTR